VAPSAGQPRVRLCVLTAGISLICSELNKSIVQAIIWRVLE
jgi:hypothetical protein